MKIRSLCLAALFPAAAFAADVIPLDAQAPFEPEGKPLAGLVITLDPGHGGSSSQTEDKSYSGSARGVNSRVVEGDLNMLVASELRWHLINAGAKVFMTHLDDRKVSLNRPGEPTGRDEELDSRTKVATDNHSHLFLALHHNASPPKADGVVILLYSKDKDGSEQPIEAEFGKILREEVEKKVHQGKPFNLLEMDHPLVGRAPLPSCVIEFGFITNPDFDKWVSQRGSHRDEAIGAYNGVVRMWKEHRADLEALNKKMYGDEVVATPSAPAEKPNRFASMAASLGAKSPLQDAADANRLLSLFRRTALSDQTTFYLRTAVEKTDAGWTLTGEADNEIVAKAAASLLEAAGCTPLKNEIAMLPAADLGEQKFGVVQIPMALTWGEPREGADVQTQLLLGEPVFLLKKNTDGTYYLLHASDGYVGWVRRDAVRLMAAAEFDAWNAQPVARVAKDFLVDDFRLPAGGLLPVLANDHDTTITVRLPMAVRGSKMTEQALVPAANLTLPKTPSTGHRAAENATEYLTVPYVFGARSRVGLDCSGLTGTAYASVGVILPRDAKQQVLMGRMVAESWHRPDLNAGDLVYFLDDDAKVFHVGISLGGQRFLHASPPEVQVSSFDPADPLYSEGWTKRFALARRPADP